MSLNKRNPSLRSVSIACFVSVLVLAVVPVWSRAADTTTLTITAYIDGQDLLIVQGSTLQWHHLDWAAVGRLAGANVPTTISTTLNGAPVMNNFQWTPDWPFPPPNEIRFEAFSSVLTGVTPAQPSADSTVTLNIIQARGTVTIYQMPTAANGYTLIVDFNDDPEPGASTYQVELTTTTSSTPVGYGCYTFENGTPGTVASGSDSIQDYCYGNPGTPVGAPTYSSDVPDTGTPNLVSLEFNGGSDAVTFGTTSPFNQSGIDVSLDFWLKASPSENESVFWTSLDSNDTNRFDFFLNANGTFGFDYRDPNGVLHSLVGNQVAGTGIAVPSDTWTHLNVTRVGNQYFAWEGGVLMASATDASPNLPTDVGWMMSGRSGYDYQGLLDQVDVSFVTTPVQISANSFSFGSQVVNTTSAPQVATLMNTGSGPLSISSIAVGGSNSTDFAQTNTCPGSLNVGAACTISVTFIPAVTGPLTASVTVTDNASTSPQEILVTGTGTAVAGPGVSLSATSLQFGNQAVNTSSAPQTVTLTSSGTTALTISSILVTGTNSGDFPESNTCPISPSTLAVGASCTITVNFKPSAVGSRTASVSISDNAPGSPQGISLSGTGTGHPSLSAKITSQTQNGTQLTLVLSFTNVGSDNAYDIWMNQVSLRTLGGTGTVSLLSPSLPLNMGNETMGGSSSYTFQFTVPSTVTKFSVTESGTMQNTAGSSYHYSLAQVVYP